MIFKSVVGVLIFNLVLVYSQEINNKICVTSSTDQSACQQIARSNDWACTDNVVSKTDCFVNMDMGLPQFAVVTAEESFVAAPLVSKNVVVVGEITSEQHSPFQTTVVVRKPFNGTFEDLRGKRFCHPGFEHDELVTKFILNRFESKILNLTDYCNTNDNSTLVEKKIRALSSFFGYSCRPGKWTEDDVLDKNLKSKYSTLCDLCGMGGCGISYQEPFQDSLKCLTQTGSDIAISTLKHSANFFNSTENKDNYQYLCHNGVVSDIACTWDNQLNKVIIANQNIAVKVTNYLSENLASRLQKTASSSTLTASLERVLQLRKSDSINLFPSGSIPLYNYVEDRRLIPSNETASCGLTVTWCTLNNLEQNKCLWAQRAAINNGIEPVIRCRQTSSNDDPLMCLNDIENGYADITFNDVNYGYSALMKGLAIVGHLETDSRQLSSVLIVVRNDSTIKNLDSLRGRQACFPQYGGKEWLAFIDFLRAKKVLENTCNYGKLFSDFVGNSCVPGAMEDDFEIVDSDTKKLCNQCLPVDISRTALYCNPDDGNKYYGSDGALKCVSDGNGEYAVISKNDVTESQNTSMFRVLNQNGSVSELQGINVDEGAALTILTTGGIVTKNDTKKRDDIILLLKDIEFTFGQNLHKTFKMFEKFNGTADLLFPDSTPGLSFSASDIKYVNNYKSLLENSQNCIQKNDPNKSVQNLPFSTLILAVIFYVAFRF